MARNAPAGLGPGVCKQQKARLARRRTMTVMSVNTLPVRFEAMVMLPGLSSRHMKGSAVLQFSPDQPQVPLVSRL